MSSFYPFTQIILQSPILVIVAKHVFNLGIEPLNFSYQILLASALYLLAYALFKEPRSLINLDRKSLLMIFIIGAIMGGFVYGLALVGLKQSTAINYSFLTSTSIFFTPALAYLFLKEHLKPHKILLILLLMFGAYLVATGGQLILPQSGDLYILGGALAYSGAIILSKIALNRVPTLTFSLYRALFGGLSLLISLLLFHKVELVFSWSWIAIVGLITAGGIYAMNKALEYSSTSYMQMMSMAIPVVTAIFAYLILQESMSLIQMLGGIIIVVSGFFVHKLRV